MTTDSDPSPNPPASAERKRAPGPADPLALRLNQPLAIGRHTIACRLVLAPLSKIGHQAFRDIVAGHGGFGLLFSGMCGALP